MRVQSSGRSFQHKSTCHFNERSTQCRVLDAKMTFQQPNKFPRLISNRPKPLHQHSLERNRGSLNHVATIMQNREAPISFGQDI
jgi:hypothetical protein